MYHHAPLSRASAHRNFRYSYMENSAINFVEKYMVLKLKRRVLFWNLFNFIKNSEKITLSIGYSMFCVGYGIYTRERSSRVYIS